MPTLQPSIFNKYELDEREEIEGQVLSTNQKAVIQNYLADIAEEKLRYPFDPNNPHLYIQKEAELQGQLGILQMLLSVSIGAEEKLNAMNQIGGEDISEHNSHLGNPFFGATYGNSNSSSDESSS